jgi:hypothetical protein
LDPADQENATVVSVIVFDVKLVGSEGFVYPVAVAPNVSTLFALREQMAKKY